MTLAMCLGQFPCCAVNLDQSYSNSWIKASEEPKITQACACFNPYWYENRHHLSLTQVASCVSS